MEAAKKIGIWGFEGRCVSDSPRLISNKRYFGDPVIEGLDAFLETKHISLGVQA